MSALGGALDAALADRLGAPVVRASPLAGGDINVAFALELDDGRRLFVKTNPSAPDGMFQAEARGLGWLAEARAVRLPEVVAVSARPSFLVLELVEPAPRLRRRARAFARFASPGDTRRVRARPSEFHRQLAAAKHAARALGGLLPA